LNQYATDVQNKYNRWTEKNKYMAVAWLGIFLRKQIVYSGPTKINYGEYLRYTERSWKQFIQQPPEIVFARMVRANTTEALDVIFLHIGYANNF